MRVFLLLVLLLSASAMASAESGRMRLAQPEGLNLVLTKLDRGSDLRAEFAGQAWVSGTVVGRWPNGATDMNAKSPDVVFVPDPQSAARLPYFFLREPKHVLRYPVRSIELVNEIDALRIAAGDGRVRRLLERRVNHVRITGRFLIEGYVVGVECDAPWARAMLIGAEPNEQATGHHAAPEGCRSRLGRIALVRAVVAGTWLKSSFRAFYLS